MKNSTSLTSLSSMDKDYSLSSLKQYGRNASSQRSVVAGSPPSPHIGKLDQHAIQEEPVPSHRSNAVPSLPRKKRRKRRELITANLSGTGYDVVRQMVEKVGFSVAKEDDPLSYLIWNDNFIALDKISELKPYQRVNHFPGMGEICRKDALARNFAKMQKVLPDEYNFMPKTWILPSDYSLLQNHYKEMRAKKRGTTFIVKPSNGAQGHGISLYRNAEKIPPSEHFIVQEYIDKPLLLDGYKFDLRIYVLVTSCDPLRVFLFNDGLVRLATEKYLPPQESNIGHLYMHLTNYSVNKHNEFYEKNTSIDTGSKRSIKYLNEYLRRSDVDVPLLWRNIADMIVRTMLVSEPHVLHAYRMCRPGVPSGSDSVCFEVLGFDIMIDRKLRPWLIEINRSPSFGTDERLDFEIKSSLIEDTFRLLNLKVSDKRRNIAAQKAEAQKRLFRTTKKGDPNECTQIEKKKIQNSKKKEELKEILNKLRRMANKDAYDNRNMGRFRRIFPCDDKQKQERYCKLLTTAFSVFLAGRGKTMTQEIQVNYANKYREDELLDMIAECEADERDSKITLAGGKPIRGPRPLQSMPESLPPAADEEDLEDDGEDSSLGSPDLRPSPPRSRQSQRSAGSAVSLSRPGSDFTYNSQMSGLPRPQSQTNATNASQNQRSKSLQRPATQNKLTALQRSNVDDNFLNSMVKEREEELTKKTLGALNEMHIKFPGKTDQEAEYLLDQLSENWKFHKPRIASYWLVKLDSIKRRKVIEIVRSNVRAMLQRIWKTSDTDNLRLNRIFSRVLNRLLWSHGQGLWNCFASTGNSWETIFSKSSENISETEMDCCRRIVQLCKDCLLIVYKFADESKNPPNAQGAGENSQENSIQPSSSQNGGYLSGRDLKAPVNSTSQTTYSQRYTKLYQSGFSYS